MWYRSTWCFAVGFRSIGGVCGEQQFFGGGSLGVQQGQKGEPKVLPKQKGPNYCWLEGPKSSNPESRRSNKRKWQLPGFVLYEILWSRHDGTSLEARFKLLAMSSLWWWVVVYLLQLDWGLVRSRRGFPVPSSGLSSSVLFFIFFSFLILLGFGHRKFVLPPAGILPMIVNIQIRNKELWNK